MRKNEQKIIKKLQEYFQKEPSVLLAFLFGSRSKKLERKVSDWDIAVYFKPKEYMELETERDYPKEKKIEERVKRILGKKVKFVVLNRVVPSLVFEVLNSGIPLIIKDRGLYLDLLCKTHYEAVDFQDFLRDFLEIRKRAESFEKHKRSREALP